MLDIFDWASSEVVDKFACPEVSDKFVGAPVWLLVFNWAKTMGLLPNNRIAIPNTNTVKKLYFIIHYLTSCYIRHSELHSMKVFEMRFLL